MAPGVITRKLALPRDHLHRCQDELAEATHPSTAKSAGHEDHATKALRVLVSILFVANVLGMSLIFH